MFVFSSLITPPTGPPLQISLDVLSPPPFPSHHRPRPPSAVVLGVYAFVSVRLPIRQRRLPDLNDSLPRANSDDCTTSNDHGLRIRSPDPPPSLRRVHLLRLRPAFVPLAVPQGLSRPAATTGAGAGSGATAGSGASAVCKPAATAPAGTARPAQVFRE